MRQARGGWATARPSVDEILIVTDIELSAKEILLLGGYIGLVVGANPPLLKDILIAPLIDGALKSLPVQLSAAVAECASSQRFECLGVGGNLVAARRTGEGGTHVPSYLYDTSTDQ